MTQVAGTIQRLGIRLCLLTVLLLAGSGQGAFAQFSSYLPSTRWIIMGAPLFPTSYDECRAFDIEFSEEISQMSRQHDECLQGPSNEPPGNDGCSRLSCQALHSALHRAQRKRSEESRACSERVGRYIAKQREEARRRREHAEEVARDRASRAARQDRERSEWEARRERERMDREARRERRRAEREAAKQEAEARRRAEEEQLRAMAQAEAARRQAEIAEKRARDEAQMAAAREAKERQEAQEESSWLALTKKVAQASKLAHRLSATAKDPAAAAGRYGGRALNNAIIDSGLDASLGLGPAKSDDAHDLAATTGQAGLSLALRSNPFAREISKQALHATVQVQRKVLGELDRVTNDIRQFGGSAPPLPSVKPPPSAFRRVPLPAATTATDQAGDHDRRSETVAAWRQARASQAGVASGTRFSSGSSTGVSIEDHRTVSRGAPSGPTPAPVSPMQYTDPDSGQRLLIPDGHTLYRDPETRALSVVPIAGLDQITGDNDTCSSSGLGIVRPACEAQRRQAANPFAQRATQ